MLPGANDHMPTDIQTAALDYLGAGLHILALTGKKPNPRVHGDHWSWDDSFSGAPASEAEWEAVGAAFSEARGTTGIAILIPPDFLVADVDSDRAAGLLKDLGFVANEETVAAQTKNGLHVWFWSPGANRNRWLGDGQEPNPNRTLLLKGLGGYVVAPPSLHFDASGAVDGTYSWVTSLVSDGRIIMPDTIPPEAAKRFAAEDQYAAAAPPKHTLTTFTLIPEAGVPWYLWAKEWNYGLEGLEHAIETAADGNQNNVIHWAAMTAREEGVPYEVAMEHLLAAAERGNHPRNRARDTIRGAFKRAARG